MDKSGATAHSDNIASPLFKSTAVEIPSPIELDEDFHRFNINNKFATLSRSELLLKHNVNIKLKNRICSKDEEILSIELAHQIQKHLPSKYQIASSWSLVYSNAQHGFSLNTLYIQCKHYVSSASLLVIKDDRDQIFGTFVSEPWASHIGHFGTGQTLLWKSKSHDEVSIFKSTGKNRYFQIAEPNFIAVGCGDSKFGIWLDKELLNGCSSKVPTFDNEVLASRENFICVGVELWSFDNS